MAARKMVSGSMQRSALVALLAGGLVLGFGAPALAATPLGSKPGASSGFGLPRPSTNCYGNVVATDREVIPLGAKPGVISGSNVVDADGEVFLLRSQPGSVAFPHRRSGATSATI
jgi:hypothetical protein